MKIGLVNLHIITLGLLSIFISGCNSEGAFDSGIVDSGIVDSGIVDSEDIEPGTEPRDGGIFDIDVTPYFIGIQKRKSQQLKAIASYEYYNESTLIDITDSAIWEAENLQVVSLTDTGEVYGIEKGKTSVMVSKDGLSKTVEVNVCDDLAGVCVDFYDVGNNKLVTNSPSVAFLDHLDWDESGNAHADTYYEGDLDNPPEGANNIAYWGNGTRINGPEGLFYIFSFEQALLVCQSYNTYQIGGRNNWRLPERNDLQFDVLDNVYNTGESLFDTRGWPTSYGYWTSTSSYNDGTAFYMFSLISGGLTNVTDGINGYVSCVSDP